MKYDNQLVSFTICLCVISYLLLFGIETRFHIIRIGDQTGLPIPFLLLAIFLLTVFLISRYLQFRIATYPAVSVKGKPVIVKYRPAEKIVQDYVQYRAKSLGVVSKIDVLVLPASYNTVDAYVFGSGRNHSLVLTGGAQALYMSREEKAINNFILLIDHELGHIDGQDTGILYFSRSILYATLLLVPLKFLAILLVASQNDGNLSRLYSDIFPAIEKNFTNSSYYLSTTTPDTLVSTPFPFAAIVVCLVVFSCLLLLMLHFFYREIVRRREYIADRFALEHSKINLGAVVKNIEELLNYATISGQPAQAFKSGSRYHPSPASRIKNLLSPEHGKLPSGIAVVCVLGVCFCFRFCYGNTTQSIRSLYNMTNLILCSGVFCLLLGLICYTILNTPDRRGIDKEAGKICSSLVIWSLLIAGVYAAIFVILSSAMGKPYPDSLGANQGSGGEELKALSLSGKLNLIFSFPATVIVFGLIFLIMPMVWKNHGKSVYTRTLAVFGGSATSVVVLAAIAMIWSGLYRNHTDTLFKTFMEKQAKWAQQPHRSFGDSFLPEKDTTLTGEGDLESMALANTGIKVMSDQYQKSGLLLIPPLAFLALWQAPFNSAIY